MNAFWEHKETLFWLQTVFGVGAIVSIVIGAIAAIVMVFVLGSHAMVPIKKLEREHEVRLIKLTKGVHDAEARQSRPFGCRD